MLGKLEEQWVKSNSPEDDLFYYHPSEDKIVLSHALFWVMPQNIRGKVGKVPLASPSISGGDARSLYDFSINLDARKLAAVTIVAGGYGGDMPEDQAYDLLDDIDFYYIKVKCRKIEKLLPVLGKLVIEEQKLL